ncbi:MAG: [Clostridia bacterium]|nr:[FeFe] hydrogenase H-cluster maturation GTPase HydF [Clostridia bacterium]
MSLQDTPAAERICIGFFGLRNAGKSSLVNRITNQPMSVVSSVKGTTTDPVRKSMELLPLGPVTIVDTPGFDDEGDLGELRIQRTREVLSVCDIAVLVTEAGRALLPDEEKLLALMEARGIPRIIACNKADLSAENKIQGSLLVSAATGDGIEALKNAIAASLQGKRKEIRFVADLIKKNDFVVLVTPIDSSAPKGRMILPQQQAIRDILDAGAVSLVTGVDTLQTTLASLSVPPALVITDSQVFGQVMKLVPASLPLTSFSILMARYKGFLSEAVRGASALDALPDGAHVLIAEGCTHHRQCEDIGTVKLPGWLKKHTGKDLQFTFTSGHGFPEDLTGFDCIIHCGGCMLHDNEMRLRMERAVKAGVPFTNYGTAIAHMHGILARSIAPLSERNSIDGKILLKN